MILRGARIVVISGIAFFALRGVIGAMAPASIAIAVLLLLGGAALLEYRCVARATCQIGELACRQGLLTADCVARILSLQKTAGGRFGEIAVRENFLSPGQLKSLLDLQAG